MVNSKWYITQCIPQVLKKIKESRPKVELRGISIHSAYSAAHLLFLENSRGKLLGHPPYNPDLAPCDVFLVPEINKKIRGWMFLVPEEAVAEFVKEKCIKHDGEYYSYLLCETFQGRPRANVEVISH